MAASVVALACTNCGGTLDVKENADRVTCQYCGSDMVVRRSNRGTALQSVTEAIKQVQAGTDKAAAELAIIRLEKELEGLVQTAKSLQEKESTSVGKGILLGAFVVVAGLLFLFNGDIGFGLMISAIGVVVIYAAIHLCKDLSPVVETTAARIVRLKALIAEKKQIANG